MALISIKRNVDLQPGLNAPAVFNCSQSDKGTTIMLGLMNGGNDYTVPSGVTITIRGSRSNGAVFTPTSATFSGSTVSFTLTEEMTDTAGPTLCEAVLEQGNNVLGTANFIINVEGSPMGADVPPVFTDAAWAWMLGKLTTETVPALGDDVISSIQGKVDKSQGSANAKKFLRVNTSGNVSLTSTDKTLSVWDQIADAKETGDQIRALDAEIDGVASTLGGSISTLNGITTDLQSSKLNKNQGTSNAGKTMVVNSSGNIVPGDALALKANESTIAPEFDPSGSYTAGSYVLKNGVLYRFTSAHTGAWTGSDAETVTVGGELTRLDNDSGSGLTEDIKTALLACFEKVAWIDEDGQDYYDALYDALYPPADLVSISAVFTQGSAVIYETDSLDTLKQYLVVTGHMSDSTLRTITTYTLSGTLSVGTSTITVSYSGKTTTFSVIVSQAPTVNSISAAYTQSGTVYNTDSLDSLKNNLVVTAYYSDSTSRNVIDYTLSGTLSVGTSTITVSYGGKTTTFTVTVTEASIDYLYNWDLTQSLVDSVSSREVTLGAKSGTSNAVQDNNGLSFNAATQYAYLGQISMVGKTIEIDVASFDFKGNTGYHIRFLSNAQYATSTSKGLGGIVWRAGLGWTSFGWSTETGTSTAWSANYWSSSLTGNTSEVINAFNGKTIKVVYHSDGHTKDLYINNEKVGTISDIYFNNSGSVHWSDRMFIAGMASVGADKGDQCYDMTITGIRIYANNE